MTQGHAEPAPGRRESFPAAGPIEVDARLSGGSLELLAVDATGITVEVRADEHNVSRELAARAVRETDVQFSVSGGKLVVRSPRHPDLRKVSLAVSATVPSRSALAARAGWGSIRVDGTIARLTAATGSGDIETADIEGSVELKAGSGDTRLGRVGGRMRSRSGSGSFEARAIDQAATITTGSGSIHVGEVAADLAARTGSGSVTVGDATAGRLDLVTGSGDIRVGIHDGVGAEIDLVSGSGRARSELDVSPRPAEGDAAVRVRARTGSGQAVVARAASG